jgi:hypothetical protein
MPLFGENLGGIGKRVRVELLACPALDGRSTTG